MPIQIVRNDITRMRVDAIVNAANESLLGGGGVDGAIHKAAGPELLKECRTLGGCRTGDAKLTRGYNLPCKYVIHTVGPVWREGSARESSLLYSCYWCSLRLAAQQGCESVAFPLISAGAYGCPKEKALQVAMRAIGDFLMKSDMLVYIVVYDRESYHLSGKLFADVSQFVDDRYVEEHTDFRRKQIRMTAAAPMPTAAYNEYASFSADGFLDECECAPQASLSLEDALNQIDESFSQMVLRLIDEKGMKDSTCYKRANIDRKHFSKIRGDVFYKPKKTTAVAIAIALELTLDQTRDLLMKAGLALSRSSKFDIIIEYCLLHGIYDIHQVNQLLFDFDQVTLGVGA